MNAPLTAHGADSSCGGEAPHAAPFDGDALMPGLDALPHTVLIVDQAGLVLYGNPAAEAELAISRRQLKGARLTALFIDLGGLPALLRELREQGFLAQRQDLVLQRPGSDPVHMHAIVSGLEAHPDLVMLQLLPNEQKIRSEREERILDLASANKELIRNLAHEIKNPLGGIRGAAQLLEYELPDRALREYTQVIIKESDRLQTLVDRLLEPHRHPLIVTDVNIHEVFERVRSVVLAEFPVGLSILRDYDASLPEIRGDKEQLIQAVLNIVHNAAQALAARVAEGEARIILRSRIARRVTIAKKRHKLALDLHIVDNGPGIPEDIRDRIFYPLVSGREGGSGLGLTLAQTFIQQHQGLIECDSYPGHTDFRILLPVI